MRKLNDNQNKEELIKIATDFSNEMAQLGFYIIYLDEKR